MNKYMINPFATPAEGSVFLDRLAGKNLMNRARNAGKYSAFNAPIDIAFDTNPFLEYTDKLATDLTLANNLAQKYSPIARGITKLSKIAPAFGGAVRFAPGIANAITAYTLGEAAYKAGAYLYNDLINNNGKEISKEYRERYLEDPYDN